MADEALPADWLDYGRNSMPSGGSNEVISFILGDKPLDEYPLINVFSGHPYTSAEWWTPSNHGHIVSIWDHPTQIVLGDYMRAAAEGSRGYKSGQTPSSFLYGGHYGEHLWWFDVPFPIDLSKVYQEGCMQSDLIWEDGDVDVQPPCYPGCEGGGGDGDCDTRPGVGLVWPRGTR